MPGRFSPWRRWDRSGHRNRRAPRDRHPDAGQGPVRELPLQFRHLSVPVTAGADPAIIVVTDGLAR